MNITLSAPPETIRTVREWAKKENTSLNQYIRDCLEEKAKEVEEKRKRESEEFHRFLVDMPRVKMPKGWKFSREEAEFRDMKCLREE
jgi:hypothetical protein